MKIKCPACAAEVAVDASMSGQVIDCTCGKKLRVPCIPSAGTGSEDGSANLVNHQEMEGNPLGAPQGEAQNPFAAPVTSDAQANPYASPSGTGLAYQSLPQGYTTASLVLGVTSLVTTFLCCGGFIFAIPAVICGVIGVKQAKQGVAGGKGMAVAGLVMGGIVLALTLIVILVYAGMAFFAIQNQGAPPF